ncbi:SDR family oxidoreductase [Hyalangium versicolor]|uniref:SDR family oxidoreductase n=1 Tax=Hyalangium versicolor TaxID=2861190 RepID=UPI001CD01294|nr:SDR family oxidoreductase [Hyalangium versicolor]
MPISVITGASTGIGRCTALHLARQGHQVVATMRDVARGEPLRKAVRDEGLAIEIAALDVDDEGSVDSAFAHIHEAHGRIDVLVNNAGVSSIGTAEDAPIAEWKAVFETNFFGAVRCCRAVLSRMRQRCAGHIINVSSVAGRMASVGQASYSVSKFALEGFSELLANEVAPFQIRVSIIEPGVTVTPIFGKQTKIPAGSAYGPIYERMSALYTVLLKKASRPEVIAAVIHQALTSEAPRLRWPAGPDAHALLAARLAMTDDEWLELGVPGQEGYRQLFAKHFGVELALEEGSE